METQLMNSIKMYAELSNQYSGWALSILAGSIITLISSSYIKPLNRKVRFVYLLFLPGWICIAVSLYYNDAIYKGVVAASMAKNDDRLINIASNINAGFANQLTFFNLSLIVFGIWLVFYLFWWIIVNENPKKIKS